ncbi:disease resistance protein RPV1-like [Rosa rugosa]|uniref:disease resistance protein RPV1-like n=1 Tax=Rosa rugosa TaxID=74645 RepID=UPI002B4108CE|nr:disease resistance protein RPV1-like [Rosa rugosa]
MATQLRASSSFSSISFSTRSYTYDVFLSFRGEDTRYNFTDHLHKYLVLNRINTFKDDELTRGEEISQALLRAIEGSKLSLIVFSENYASSKWCLDELVHILDCKRSNNQMVQPIFYNVDPSEVRHQRGKFGEALAEHERRFKDDMDKVLRWRAALSEAANLSGWHFSGGYESLFIDRIVEEISTQVKEPTYLDMPKCQVGLDSRVQDMLEILDVDRDDVRMVGIWGTGGIGKTTIAKAVYNKIAHKFKASCFLANVREGSEPHGGLVNLQNIILSKIVVGKELMATNVYEGSTLLRERLRDKRILLVLDDVNKLDQLNKLAGTSDWFQHGSRVIITTRDKHLLIAHQVKPIYEVRELGRLEAHKLFSSYAFKDNKNLDDNEKLSVSSIVEYAKGLPLALEVLGSCLCDTSIYKWQAMLHGFKRNPPKDIRDVLIISYDGLQETVQKVFLDIACFFKGWNRNDVIQILEGCGHINPEHSIKVLEENALIYVGRYLSMHDLLEEMGKEIVYRQSPNEPGERNRLWYHEDVRQVLTKNTGTSKIEGIIVKLPTIYEIHLSPRCFKKMKNLKIFINVNGVLCGEVDYLPNELRLLDWPYYPSQYLPSNFTMKNLVQLNICESRISCLGEGFKSLPNLKSLNLSKCKFLTKIPDLSGSPSLEWLHLGGCSSLYEIHPSIGVLEKLVHLFLQGCSNLMMLPRKVHWRSLRFICLNDCTRLENFPEIEGEMKYLKDLNLWNTAIKELPSSVGHLINLEELHVMECKNFTNLPGSIYELQKLKKVKLYDCPKLRTFPNKVDSEVLPTYSKVSHDNSDSEFDLALPWLFEFTAGGCNLSNTDFLASFDCACSLYELDLSGSPIVILSECINKFVNLSRLNLRGCTRLVEIPKLPSRIEWLYLRDCVSLERISKLSNILERKESQMIKEMDLTNCWRLCENLVQMANKDDEDELDADLFSKLLSSQQVEFTVRFPGSEVPKWFGCQMDFKGFRRFEFCIEILENFKWDNTGLAVCVVVDQKLQDTCGVCAFKVYIHINEVSVSRLGTQYVVSEQSDHVWLHYIPFLDMWRFGYARPLPPFTCVVTIFQCNHSKASLKTCGVHLVIPANEDVCMRLSHAENLNNEFPSDLYQDYWENYRPKQRTDCKVLYTDAQLENEKV